MRRLLTLYYFAFMLLLAQAAPAANWEWGSRVGLNSNWNDNPALADEDRNPVSTFRMVATYDGDFVRLAPSTELLFEPRVTRDYYPDKKFKDLESTDFFLPGNFRYTRQRTNWRLGWNLSRQNVLSDTQTVSEDQNIRFLNADDTVYRASLSPTASWSLSEKDQVSLSFSFSGQKYELPNTNRADSIGGFAGFSYLRTLTQRQRLGFSANYGSFRSDNTRRRDQLVIEEPFCLITIIKDRETETITDSVNDSFTLDYTFQIAATSSFSASVGLQTTETEQEQTDVETGETYPKVDPNCLGLAPNLPNINEFSSTTYNISYRKALLRGEYALRATRSVTANVAGQPQDRYDLRASGNLEWSQKLAFDWRLNGWRQQNVAFASAETDAGETYFFGARLRARWALTRKWNIVASYEYRYRDRPDTNLPDGSTIDGRTAYSNSLALGVGYNFKTYQR